jgi:hypothetical protein
MPTLPDVHMRGTRAQQPLPSAVSVGTLYFVTNENLCERSNGSAWESYSAALFAADGALEARVAALEHTVQQLIDPTARTKKKR